MNWWTDFYSLLLYQVEPVLILINRILSWVVRIFQSPLFWFGGFLTFWFSSMFFLVWQGTYYRMTGMTVSQVVDHYCVYPLLRTLAETLADVGFLFLPGFLVATWFKEYTK